MLRQKVFPRAGQINGALALRQQIFPDFRYFQRRRVTLCHNGRVGGPFVGDLFVRLIQQRKHRFVIQQAVQHLFVVAHNVFKSAVGSWVLGADNAAQLVQDGHLAGLHGFYGVCVRQVPGFIHQKDVRLAAVQTAVAVVQRHIFRVGQLAADFVHQGAEILFRLIRRHQQGGALQNFLDGFLHLAGQCPIRCYRKQLAEPRFQQHQQNKDGRHREGLEILAADFQHGRFVPPVLFIGPVHHAQHRHIEKPLVAHSSVIHAHPGPQAAGHPHHLQQLGDLGQALFVDAVFWVHPISNADKLGGLLADVPPYRLLYPLAMLRHRPSQYQLGVFVRRVLLNRHRPVK